MELTEEQRKDIEEIASGLNCSKDFECYKSGSVCKTRDFGLDRYLDCL